MTIKKIDLSAKLKGINKDETKETLADILATILLTGKGIFPSILKNGSIGYGLKDNPILEVDEVDLNTIIEGLEKSDSFHVFALYQVIQALKSKNDAK